MQTKSHSGENDITTKNTGFKEVKQTYLKNKPNANITKSSDQTNKTNQSKSQTHIRKNHGIYSMNKTITSYLDKSSEKSKYEKNTFKRFSSQHYDNPCKRQNSEKPSHSTKGISYNKYLILKDKAQTKTVTNTNKEKIDSQSKEYCLNNNDKEETKQPNMFHGLTLDKEDVEDLNNFNEPNNLK